MALKEALLAATIVAWIAGCKPASPGLPEELTGMWQTPEPKYAGRFFQLAGERIVFGTGAGSVSVHTIKTIRISPDAGDLLYTITYAGDGGQDYQWSFVYHRGQGGAIWFKNQPDIIWRKKGR